MTQHRDHSSQGQNTTGLRRGLRKPLPARRAQAIAAALIVAAVLAGAYAFYRRVAAQIESAARRDLTTVSALKASELARWRRERLADGQVMQSSPGSVVAARLLQDTPATAASDPGAAPVARRLGSRLAYGQYDSIYLVDQAGRVRVSVPTGRVLVPLAVRASMDTERVGRVRMLDFFRDERDQTVRLAVLAPLLDDAGVVLGTVVMSINPTLFLNDYLQSWPTLTESSETLLVRREGAEVLFLNPTRFDAGAALRMRIPMARQDVLAVQAAMGEIGPREGRDYRGGRVLGSLLPVSESPWYLVAKSDLAEIRAPLSQWRIAISSSVVLILFVGLLIRWVVARGQRAAYLQRELGLAVVVQQQLEQLQMVTRGGGHAIWELDIATGDADVSVEFATQLGLNPVFQRQPFAALMDRVHPADQPVVRGLLDTLRKGDSDEQPILFRVGAGSEPWTWLNLRMHLSERDPEGHPLRAIGLTTDLTDLKLAELRSLRFAQLYATLSHSNDAMVGCSGPEELYAQVCKAAVAYGGMGLAWVGLTDDETGRVRVAATAGETDYLQDIVITARVDDPHGQGPAGTAIREGRPVWVEDFSTNAIMRPWHERGRKYGWAAAVALPIRRSGRAIGALMFYTSAVPSFDVDDRRLLTELAANLGLALDRFVLAEQQRVAEAAIQRALLEKDALLGEVHHRVKNNLQVIVSLLRLESARAASPLVTRVTDDMQTRLLSMALLHEMLYRTGTFATVDLGGYLGRLVSQLGSTVAPRSGVTVAVDLCPLSVDMDTAVPCGLLLNELISNALKHAFPDGRQGQVTVSLKADPGGTIVHLSVADTGVGFPQGCDPLHGDTLGLKLVASLARQLRGTLAFGQAPGASVTLSFEPAVAADAAPVRS